MNAEIHYNRRLKVLNSEMSTLACEIYASHTLLENSGTLKNASSKLPMEDMELHLTL